MLFNSTFKNVLNLHNRIFSIKKTIKTHRYVMLQMIMLLTKLWEREWWIKTIFTFCKYSMAIYDFFSNLVDEYYITKHIRGKCIYAFCITYVSKQSELTSYPEN